MARSESHESGDLRGCRDERWSWSQAQLRPGHAVGAEAWYQEAVHATESKQ
jgi:hypothetical protein